MNVMNRKLFANRDARRKLANMGGIVASSPELLGTAQTFQNGGTVPSRRSDIKFFELFRPLLRSGGPNTAREAEIINDVRNTQFSREAEKVRDLLRFYSKTDPDYAKLLEEKYALYLNKKADELDALFQIRSGDVDEVDNSGIQALLPQMDSPASNFSIVLPQEPTRRYTPSSSRQSDYSRQSDTNPFDSLYRGIIDTLDQKNLAFTDRTDAPRYATSIKKRDRKRILDNNLFGHQSLYFPTGDDAKSQAIADINRRALDFIKSDTYQPPSEIYGETDPLAAEKALLATDNATKVMALRRRIPVEEYINSLDPEVIRRNAQRVLEAQDSASIKAQDDAVIEQLTLRGEMPGQLDFVSVNPSYTENQTDRFNSLDKSSLTDPVTDAIVPRPRDIRDLDPRTLNLSQKAVQDLVIAEENRKAPSLLESGFDYSQLKPEEKPSFMDVLKLGKDITVEGTKRIDQALFGNYEDKLLPVGSVPTAREEVRAINGLLKNETDPLKIQLLNKRREELLGKLNVEEFDRDAKEFIMSIPQTAGDLAGKAGSALYRLYQENVVASNDPEAAYNNLISLAESDAFTEELIRLRDEDAIAKEAAREKELAELKAGDSDPEIKTVAQARAEARNVILNPPSSVAIADVVEEEKATDTAKTDTSAGTGGGDAGAGAGGPSNAEIVNETQNAVTNATEKGGDTNEAASKAILDTAGIDTSNMSTKERVVSFKNLLSELAGDTEEEKKEEFWMNMAMIGFGIAAGESESALKNIADGLLAGSSQMLKSRANRKAREDKFTMAALDNVLAEQRAETKFGRDVKLANIRAGANSGQTTATNFYNVLLKEETNIRDQNKQAVSKNDPSIVPENQIRFEALRRLKDIPVYKEQATPLFIEQKKILNID